MNSLVTLDEELVKCNMCKLMKSKDDFWGKKTNKVTKLCSDCRDKTLCKYHKYKKKGGLLEVHIEVPIETYKVCTRCKQKKGIDHFRHIRITSTITKMCSDCREQDRRWLK